MSIAGLVLAGGGSQRMGQDKALLKWQGKSLLDHAVQTLLDICPQVYIASSNSKHRHPFAPQIPDAHGGKGPLDALATAMKSLDSEWFLLLPVDMPLMQAESLQHLVDGRINGLEAVFYVQAGHPQPQIACYHRSLLQKALLQLKGEDWSLRSLLKGTTHYSLDADSMGLPATHFNNFNSEADWREFLSR